MAIDNPSNLMPDQEIIIEGDAGFVPKASPSDAGKVLGVLNASGDVGWVVDQSGTFTQVQADWAETDSSKPSYIDNKPDLSVYATASSVETALSGKQDTISDLSEIRAGAAKGDTAVQPSALDDYATTSALNTALAGKQDTISDLEAIRAGAQSGSTAVQPATLESYATTSAMETALAGKQDTISDLATIRSGAQAGATAVQPSALESYATTSAMNTALAGKQDTISDLATIRAGAAAGATAAQPSDLPSSDELVPSATSVDAGKVLTVDSNGDPSWQPAQGGGSSYTAGDGIDIDANNEISVAYDSDTLDMALSFVSLTPHGSDQLYQDGTDLTNWVLNGVEGETLRVKIPGMAFLTNGELDSGDTMHIAIADYHGARFYSTALSVTYWGSYYMIDEQTVDVPLPVLSTTGWGGDMAEYPMDPESSYIRMTFARVNSGRLLNGYYAHYYGSPQKSIQIANLSTEKLSVKNPLPVYTSSLPGSVLKLDANGNPKWLVDGFTNTAGITDIQQVAALPANPVATVLYLIPET